MEHVESDDMPTGVEHTFDGTRRWYPEDVVRQMLAESWREAWLAGNRWAFAEADEDAIETNPYAAKLVCGGCGATAPEGTEGWRRTDAAWCPTCRWLA